MKIFGAPMEVKDLTDAGTFDGLAAVYGNTDLGGDIVMPGAFKEVMLTKDGMVRILDGHNTRSPIGKGKLTDTHLGLAIKGMFEMSVARAREVHALMKSGIIDGLSIGFDILPNGYKISEDGLTRQLTALKLWEVSTTPFPMNESATVSGVKELTRATSVREVEDLLRDVVGLSRSKAKLHAAEIWKTKSGLRDAGEDEGVVAQRLTDFFKGVVPA